MAAHEMLPREVDLAEELGVSRSTLRQVLRALADSGLIYSVRGSGTFVSPTRIAKDTTLSGFSEDMRARGLEPGSQLLDAEPLAVDGTVATDLAVPDGTLAYRLDRLRLADSKPMCLEEVILLADPFPGLLTHDISAGLYELLKAAYGVEVTMAQQWISASVAAESQASLLEVDPGAPLLEVRRVGYDGRGRAIERAVSHYRADRYEFVLTARRGDHG